jgi:hypothetical protein
MATVAASGVVDLVDRDLRLLRLPTPPNESCAGPDLRISPRLQQCVQDVVIRFIVMLSVWGARVCVWPAACRQCAAQPGNCES